MLERPTVGGRLGKNRSNRTSAQRTELLSVDRPDLYQQGLPIAHHQGHISQMNHSDPQDQALRLLKQK